MAAFSRASVWGESSAAALMQTSAARTVERSARPWRVGVGAHPKQVARDKVRADDRTYHLVNYEIAVLSGKMAGDPGFDLDGKSAAPCRPVGKGRHSRDLLRNCPDIRIAERGDYPRSVT